MSEEPIVPVTTKPKIGTIEVTLDLNPEHPPVFDIQTPRGARAVHAIPRIKKASVLFEQTPRHSVVVAVTFVADLDAEPVDRRLLLLPLGSWVEDGEWCGTVVSPIDPRSGQPAPGGFTISVFEVPFTEPLTPEVPSNADVLAGFDTTDAEPGAANDTHPNHPNHPNQEDDDADPDSVH